MSMMKRLSKNLLNFVSTSKERAIIEARLVTESNHQAAKLVGIPRRTVDRAVNRVINRAEEEGVGSSFVPESKILILDIETAPMLSYLWNLWPKGGINHQMVERPTYILSWAAKWLGAEETLFDALCYNEDYSAGEENDRRMLEGIWRLLDDADFVVAHNGDRFDVKHLNTAFFMAGLRPPRPYRQIDTLKMVRRTFAFDSNRLDYLLTRLFGRTKMDAGGFETWRQCMLGNMEAWDTLVRYNIQDTLDVEELYLAIRGWDKGHPNITTNTGGSGARRCSTCGSENVVELPDAAVCTNVSRFSLYQCGDCGSHLRGRTNLLTQQDKETLLVKAR